MKLRIAAYCLASFLAGAVLTLKLAQAFAPAGEGAAAVEVIPIAPAQRQTLEARHELDRWLDDELLFREGLRRGYALDDLIVRREVQRRARGALLAEQASAPPDDAALQAYLDQHADRYQAPPRYSYTQVYLSRGAHGARLEADAQALGAKLSAQPDGYARLGDPFPNGPVRKSVSASQVVSEFGLAFAQSLAQLPVGAWQGPLLSPLGAHWVRLDRVEPGRRLRLDEARAHLRTDYDDAQQQQALRAALDGLRQRYRVVDDPNAAQPVLRAAGEDEIP
jgi:hypothetical protein